MAALLWGYDGQDCKGGGFLENFMENLALLQSEKISSRPAKPLSPKTVLVPHGHFQGLVP